MAFIRPKGPFSSAKKYIARGLLNAGSKTSFFTATRDAGSSNRLPVFGSNFWKSGPKEKKRGSGWIGPGFASRTIGRNCLNRRGLRMTQKSDQICPEGFCAKACGVCSGCQCCPAALFDECHEHGGCQGKCGICQERKRLTA